MPLAAAIDSGALASIIASDDWASARERGWRCDGLHEADAQGFGGIDAAGGEQQLLGAGGTDGGEELAQAGARIGEAEAGRRQREDGAVGGDPYVAGQRQRQPAADAIAVDHGERRLAAALQRGKAVEGHRVIAAGGFGIVAVGGELRDVGAGREGLVPGACQGDRADVDVIGKSLDESGNGAPHFGGECVAALGPVEHQPAGGAAAEGGEMGGGCGNWNIIRAYRHLCLFQLSRQCATCCRNGALNGLF